MAKIFPERLPQSVLDDPKRNAERKVYEKLSCLGDKFTIFYSVPWQTFSETGAWDGEADFILAHPDMGVVILEVKGGGVSYDATLNQWYTEDRYGEKFQIKDPVDQGRRSHYSLRDKLKVFPEWNNNYALNIGHAVCFPDIFIKERTLKPDLSRNIIIDHDDLDDIDESVRRLFTHLFGQNISRGIPGANGMRMLESVLASSFQIRTPLGVELEYEERRLIELTERQMMALAFLGDRKRVAIAGCAGSGKTMLAVEKAQQLHNLGLNVLLTCYNVALASDLQKRLEGQEITVLHFHELCTEVVKQVGFRIRSAKDENEYYGSILPEALLEAAEETGAIFDAIVVDEGQDFKENYWVALSSLLKDEGYLYIFYDNNQNIYGGAQNFMGLITDQPFILNQNCRNTKAIHNTVAGFHNNPKALICQGPEGRPPEIMAYETEDEQMRIIQRLLNRLVNEEHIRTEDIAILTPRTQDKSYIQSGKKLGLFTLTAEFPRYPNGIQVSSIHKFKGLERRVIILAEIDQRYNYNADMVMYVGCSRARTHLIILHDKNAPTTLLKRIASQG